MLELTPTEQYLATLIREGGALGRQGVWPVISSL